MTRMTLLKHTKSFTLDTKVTTKMKSHIKLGLIVCLSTLLLSACIPTKTALSPMQKRQLTSRSYTVSKNNAFQAVLTVLQDQEYIIEKAESQNGLIMATVTKSGGLGARFLAASLTGEFEDSSNKYILTAIISPLPQGKQQVRMTIEHRYINTTGGTASSKRIYDATVYQTLFNDITVEIKRRAAMLGEL